MLYIFFLFVVVDLSVGVVGLILLYCIMLIGVFKLFIEESVELENLVSFMYLLWNE